MIKIKKIIKRKLKETPCYGKDNCVSLEPDLSANYSIKFMLDSNANDLGYFSYIENGWGSGIWIPEQSYGVSGFATSRLGELKKYTPDMSLENGYIVLKSNRLIARGTGERIRVTGSRGRVYNSLQTRLNQSGVDLEKSNDSETVYMIDGIEYTDDLVNNVTTFNFLRVDWDYSNNNFDNERIYKDENLENVIDRPIVDNDVFIDRPTINVLGDIYRFNDIDKSATIENYGGNYFNIKKNT